MQLYVFVDYFVQQFGGEQFGFGGDFGGQFFLVVVYYVVVGEDLCYVDLGMYFGEFEVGVLEVCYWLVEGLVFFYVVDGCL